MTIYRVTDLNTMEEVQRGDTVTDFRGETAEFLSVTRGVEYNGTAKVETRRNGFTSENYAQVFYLRVETLEGPAGTTTPAGPADALTAVQDPLLTLLEETERDDQ